MLQLYNLQQRFTIVNGHGMQFRAIETLMLFVHIRAIGLILFLKTMKHKLPFFLLLLTFQTPIVAQKNFAIYFDFNKDELSENNKYQIDSIITANKTLVISKIEGFCDKIDSDSYNKKLALKRAQSVLDFLKSKNISINENIEITAFGENFKQSKNESKNRKAIIYFVANDLKNQMNFVKKGDYVKLKNINFLNNSNSILYDSKPTLFELLKILQEKKKLKIEIQGHICCKSKSFPDTISASRAKAVYDFLIKNKINKNRLQYKGLGVSKPLFSIPEKNEFEMNQNRRVEILILEN